jgi:hypothetical protein
MGWLTTSHPVLDAAGADPRTEEGEHISNVIIKIDETHFHRRYG